MCVCLLVSFQTELQAHVFGLKESPLCGYKPRPSSQDARHNSWMVPSTHSLLGREGTSVGRLSICLHSTWESNPGPLGCESSVAATAGTALYHTHTGGRTQPPTHNQYPSTAEWLRVWMQRRCPSVSTPPRNWTWDLVLGAENFTDVVCMCVCVRAMCIRVFLCVDVGREAGK